MDQLLHIELVLRSIVITKVRISADVDFLLIVVTFYHRKATLYGIQATEAPFTLNADPAVVVEEGLRFFSDMYIQAIIPERYRLIVQVFLDFLQELDIVFSI